MDAGEDGQQRNEVDEDERDRRPNVDALVSVGGPPGLLPRGEGLSCQRLGAY
jgi:hypothetical protein